MNKDVWTFFTVLCLLSTMVLMGCKVVKAVPIVIHVPADYPTVQAAINNARNGDTIQVSKGTYKENVVVNKTISLIGEDKSNTIIDGGNVGDAIFVTADNVTISGFTATSGESGWPHGGINIEARNSVITGNNASYNKGDGIISSFDGHNNSIFNNVASHNMEGIRVDGFYSLAQVANNTIEFNQGDGVFLYSVSNASFEDNVISSNGHGGIAVQAGSINVTLKRNLIFDNYWEGVGLQNTNNSLVEENIIVRSGAHALNGYLVGIGLDHANNNIVVGNDLISNRVGLADSSSSDNLIYHNDFYNNVQQVVLDPQAHNNVWDHGYPVGGNYWSDYGGIDLFSGRYQNETGHDWIGDTAYVIDGNNRDNYPLMVPFLTYSGVISDYANLLRDFSSLNTAYQKLMADYSKLAPRLDSLNETVLNMASQISSLKTTVADLQKQITTLDTTVNSTRSGLQAQIISLSTQVVGLQSRLESLNETVQSLTNTDQGNYNSLTNQLNSIMNMTYALIAIVVVLVIAVAYLIIRKPKQ
jgi:parallel beta-helix repeat protein